MKNRKLYLETISELRNDARELNDKACIIWNNRRIAIKFLEKESKLTYIANKLEDYLRDN